MNNSERTRNEIIIILLLILTLAFTSSNLTPESLKEQSSVDRLPLTEAIN